jgi:hypothetical protein
VATRARAPPPSLHMSAGQGGFVSRSIRGRRVAAACAVLMLFGSDVSAQGAGRSMDIDLSVRSAAMGGASSAVWWGEEQNHWANPALLSATLGIRHEHGRTQLVPGLANDVFLKSDVVKVGASGMGLVFSGRPGGFGGAELDYGTSVGTDPFGNSTGVFRSFETVDSWGFGFSPIRVAEALRGMTTPTLSRVLDVAWGMNFKHAVIQLAPGTATAEGDFRDVGVFARFTPTGLVRRSAEQGSFPLHADLCYGVSLLNYNDERFHFPLEDEPTPASLHQRHGGALRLAFDPFTETADDQPPTWAGTIREAVGPLVEFGFSVENVSIGAGDRRDYETRGWGMEITVARVFSLRRGHYTDRTGGIDGETTGWSAGIPLGRFGGVLYQKATFPQASDSGLADLERDAWVAWIEPMALLRVAHGRR